MSKSIRLIVGLGNPGPEYAATRHNAGFHFVDALAARKGASFHDERKFQGEVCRITLAGHDVWLLKPTTFMNCSGRAVAALALYYKIQPDEILVVHDEMDLEPGTMRLKQGGGNAGHNGLKDITAALSTPNFWRLRLGIGHPRKLGLAQEVFAFVLSAPNADHEAALRQCIDAGISVVEEIAGGGFEKAQRRLEPLSGRPEKNTRATSTAPAKKGGPKILVSRCLLGYKCRYDGESRPSLFEALAEKGWGANDIITFCPETEGGLPTPREPAEIVSDEGGDGHAVIAKLAHVVTRSGTDVTAEYLRGARKALKAARSADIVCVLGKARSPACGCGSIYDGTHAEMLRPGSGVAAALLEKNGYLVLTEEELDQLPPKPAP